MNGLFLSPSQIFRVLESLPFFCAFSSETLKNLAAGSRQSHFSRKEVVFRKGEQANNLYVVVDGQVRLILLTAKGAERVISTVGRGEAFGLAAVCLNASHPTDAVAKSDSYVLRVDRNILLKEAARDCTLAMRLFKETARGKLNLMRDLENCTPRSSLQRVACFLLQHVPASHTGAYDIRLSLTKREVAAKLDLTPETLSRMLHQLKDAKAIDVQGHLIRVLDGALLASIRIADCSAGS
jgi:CRP-like cAMP-binding protein